MGFIAGADGYNFSRPADNIYHVTIYTDNSVSVMYINDVCSYTNRIYGTQKNCWSINNYGGKIDIATLLSVIINRKGPTLLELSLSR